MAGVIVRARAGILRGHDWVYNNEIQKVFGEPSAGDVVSIKDGRDRLLGSGIYNPHSQITVRRFSRQRQGLDGEFFRRRIARAAADRDRWGVRPDLRRLVYSDSDGLPGLIIDRYGPALVVQTVSAAMDRALPEITAAVVELFDPAVVVERNDAPVRKAEGLEARTGILHGAIPEGMSFEVGGVRFEPDLLGGHKTGVYLDQIANHAAVAAHAAGRRVLDCFSFNGGFGLACAKAGAAEVVCVESSAAHVEKIRATAALNNLEVTAECANAFDWLRAAGRAGKGFDLVILDPPSFTKTRGETQDALRGYKELHLRAFGLLSPGGLLATFSCSHHVGWRGLLDIARDAMGDARCSARVIGRFTQNHDHPALVMMPETEYLTGYLFEMMPGR